MPFTVTMPKLSPTMEEGVIVKWHFKEGDEVEAGAVLIEAATDKATVEYNALDGGWLRKILIPEGQKALVNQAIAIFTAEKNESIEGYQPTGVTPEVKVQPQEATQEKTKEQVVQKRSETVFQQPAFVPEAPLTEAAFNRPGRAEGERLKSSPLARKLAQERGVDISSVKGTGPGGRIVSKDLEIAQPSEVVFGRVETPQIPAGSFTEEQLSPMRQVIGKRLQESKTFVPHFYVQQSIDGEPLTEIREQLVHFGGKVTINDLVVRACALSLRKHPEINSGFNSVNQTIIRFQTIDIAIAVSLETGLITPIVRHADHKNVGEISAEVRALAKRAKEGKLEPQEYKGGSFTISNLGMFGVTDFQAIINPPQAAILAVSGILEQPVVKEGMIVVGKRMNLTLSVDHRVIDGVAAAKFLITLKGFLENPAILLT